MTGVYELSLCHVADAGSPGRCLPRALWPWLGEPLMGVREEGPRGTLG